MLKVKFEVTLSIEPRKPMGTLTGAEAAVLCEVVDARLDDIERSIDVETPGRLHGATVTPTVRFIGYEP